MVETSKRATKQQVSAALQQVRRGELSVADYVAQRVELAMAHVDPRLSPAQREDVREVLREHAMSDPLLSSQLAKLTGKPVNVE